jgi:cell division protein DivIC
MQANASLQSTKRENKGSHRRLRLLIIILLGFLCWAGITIWDQFGKLHAKKAVVSELQQHLAEVKQQGEDAKREITRLHDNEYIEQKIRKDLHYTKPGETIFFTPKTNP